MTLLLNQVIAWMRAQPGTSSLRAIVYMDDGQKSDVRNVDNGVSGTRWRLRGSVQWPVAAVSLP